MSDSIYKIFQASEWQDFQDTGVFRGSEHDVRDGFIHLCTGDQLASTLSKHYVAVNKVVLVQFNANTIGDVKWEIARGGETFPHLYNPLSSAHIKDHIELTRPEKNTIENNKAEKNEFVIPESFLNPC